MNARIIDPSLDSRWDAFVEGHPLGCIFHHSAWKQVLVQTFGQLRPLYCIAEDDQKAIRGALPCALVSSRITGKRLVSLPFSLYCDPLVDNPETFENLKAKLFSEYQAQKASFLVLRMRFSADSFQSDAFQDFVGYKNHILSLEPDLNELMHRFDRKCVQSHIHKAERSEVEVRTAETEDDIKIFFGLHVKTRKKFGTPPQPLRFFINMWNVLMPKGMMMVHTAWYRNKPISSLLCLKYKARVHAEYIGTNEVYRNISPNMLLMWKAIQEARRQEYRFFEFGGTSINNEGLLHFKRRWGTAEENIHHFFYPEVKGFSSDFARSGEGSVLSKCMKRLPNWLFVQAGKFAYRHLGG